MCSSSKEISLGHSSFHQPLSPSARWTIVALVIGLIAGIVIIGLGAADLFGHVGSTGFIGSITGGGLTILIATGGLIWMAIATCKTPTKKQCPPVPSLSHNWKKLLETPFHTAERSSLYTDSNRLDNFPKQCVEQLAQHSISIDQYQNLLVWQPSKSPSLLQGDGLVLGFPQIEKAKFALVIVVLDSKTRENKRSIHNQLNEELKGRERTHKDRSRFIIHFVDVSEPFFGPPTIHLSDDQCEKISTYQGEI